MAEIDLELKAVNRMLRSVDMLQLNSWDEMDQLAFSARDELEDVTKSVQAQGWYFNEETKILQVTVDGIIPVPENILSLKHVDNKNIIKRGAKLYDKENGTDLFGSDQQVDVVLNLDFSELPPEAVDYITNEATYIFQANTMGSKGVDQALYNKTQKSLVTLLQIDASNRDTSIFSNSDNSDFIRS